MARKASGRRQRATKSTTSAAARTRPQAGMAVESPAVAHTLPHEPRPRHTTASAASELIATPDSWLHGVMLELVGAEQATLGQQLALWQREQDRALNRAWRRPGGLARPAGL